MATESTTLYVYDEALLTKGWVRVYFKLNCNDAADIILWSGETQYDYALDENSDWIYADFVVPEGSTVFTVRLWVNSGEVYVETYSLE